MSLKSGITYLFILSTIFWACQPSENSNDTSGSTIAKRLSDLGIKLPEPVIPPGINFSPSVRSGNLVFLSGNGPIKSDGSMITGKVGSDISIEEAYDAARLTAINHLAVLKAEIGDLNKVVRIVKVNGMVNTVSGFTEHSQVINGYSDLMVEVFGEKGKHARAAVGMQALPWNIAVEVEAVVEVAEN